ncbi:MAG TPA: cytochrome c oxidase subunit II [Actinobacteria bacterium]|jgi:cytochrome c oxidase subunit 2|nr:cytochrome c oxidase subunit II [Actinomycetota bacterium]
MRHEPGGRGNRTLVLRPTRLAAFALLAVLVFTGCAGAPSTLDPHGPGASRVAGLWWFLFIVSAVVCVVFIALVVFGAMRRQKNREIPEHDASTPRWARNLVIGGGVVFPVLILSVLWVMTLHDMAALSAPTRPARLTVQVEGYQWWWRVSYPGQGIVTANEIHVPTGQPVRVVLTTNDVNHSFWVPQLVGKTDLIAGRTTSLWLQADNAGVYRGQCAEYCGLQHANMAFYVVAQSPADFRAWASNEAAAAPATDPAGQSVFENAPCAACHTIRGTTAHGTFGPDLTHFGSRMTIGAGTVPNNRGYLGGWIVNAQSIKPGSLMPPIQLSAADEQQLIDYLESLK